MKTLKYSLILLLVVLTTKLQGDIIIVKEKYAGTYVGVGNLDDYPNIEIIGYIEGLGFPKKRERAHRFSSFYNIKIPKTCSLTFYAVKKKYLKKKGIENIDWKNDKNVIKSNLRVNAKKTNRFEQMGSVSMKFDIAGFISDSIVMYKSQQICKYNFGKPESVEKFKYKGDLSKLRKRP